MLDSIYVGMAGLISFSKGLNNIGNNVANLNTPGFKRSDLEFLDLYYRHTNSGSSEEQSAAYSQGSGVRTGATLLDFSEGEFQQTGVDLDLAIRGNGFFILNKNGKTFYTRAGQFGIDDDGYLAARSDGARVAVYKGGKLDEFSVSGRRSNPPKATQSVEFVNILSTSSSTHSVSDIPVFDGLGVKHSLTLDLVNGSAGTPGQWLLTVSENGEIIATGEIRYSGAGVPETGYDHLSFTYAPGGGALDVNLEFDFGGSYYFSTSSSSLSVGKSDGYGTGFLTKVTVDSDGGIVLSYSNGQTLKEGGLALAWFANTSLLRSEGENRFVAFGNPKTIVGTPRDDGLGEIKSGGVEMSNVDLAAQFSELIIVQRGYQASSQVISAANEMIQQLGDLRGRR